MSPSFSCPCGWTIGRSALDIGNPCLRCGSRVQQVPEIDRLREPDKQNVTLPYKTPQLRRVPPEEAHQKLADFSADQSGIIARLEDDLAVARRERDDAEKDNVELREKVWSYAEANRRNGEAAMARLEQLGVLKQEVERLEKHVAEMSAAYNRVFADNSRLHWEASGRDKSTPTGEDRKRDLEELCYFLDEMAGQVCVICRERGWAMDWDHRGVYLHLEASELIEAVRGKGGSVLSEAADVLVTMMALMPGVSWAHILERLTVKIRNQLRNHSES